MNEKVRVVNQPACCEGLLRADSKSHPLPTCVTLTVTVVPLL